MFSLAGKTILVTGATGGLGGACCVAIRECGGEVYATGRREEALAALETAYCVADLATDDGRATLVEAVPECDGVVFAQGISGLSPAKYLSAGHIDELAQTNVTATLATLGLLLKKKRLRAGASVVFIASVAALTGTAANTAYAASKGALLAATRSLAVELARQGMRVNALCPGWIVTELTDKLAEGVTAESAQSDAARYPLGPGRPTDVSGATCFLLSDAARWITGTHLAVDGGYSSQ